MEILILGSGCANCRTTYDRITKVAEEMNIKVNLTKIEDIVEIAKYNIMSTPAVVVDGTIVHRGGVPTPDEIKSWLSART